MPFRPRIRKLTNDRQHVVEKKHGVTAATIVTDKLGSYSSALSELGIARRLQLTRAAINILRLELKARVPHSLITGATALSQLLKRIEASWEKPVFIWGNGQSGTFLQEFSHQLERRLRFRRG